MSQEQVIRLLAHAGVKVSKSALSRWETGKRGSPDALVLWGLANIYGEPLEDVVLGAYGRDLPRHSGSTDSSDAASTARDLEVQTHLDTAAAAIVAAATALRGASAPPRRRATGRARLHSQVG